MFILENSLLWAVLVVVGAGIGFLARHIISVKRARSLEQSAYKALLEAKTNAKELILVAKERAAQLLEEVKTEDKERQSQIAKKEERLLKREEALERELENIGAREKQLKFELDKFHENNLLLKEERSRILKELERVAGLKKEEAKEQLIKKATDESRDELVKTLKTLERDRQETLEHKGLEIITTALQRYARSHVANITTTEFQIPNEDMKGKIIGREGRNIRTLERLTGVELVMDESPLTILIASFDPLRREIARLALSKLIQDGRIQPAKIEEKVEEAKSELNTRMFQIGEESAFELGILDLPKEILQLLGRLHFRTSYGQNVLVHSVEMAYVAGMLAHELRANVEVAKRGALLHDIGKAISHEVEGTHVELGMKILAKYGISEEIINAMRSHHEDYPFATPESFIVTAADVLSAARPGARRDNLEHYIKRMADLEKIASNFSGVKTAYAISAGRELRIFVIPEQVDDFGALQLAKDIAHKVQSELKYPGEIKVNVIREVRAVEYAK